MLLLVPTREEAQGLLDGPVPTSEVPVATRLGPRSCLAALVGFGPAAAGLLAARALAAAPGAPWVLAGIAGTLDAARLPVGAVLVATEVAFDVGRGRGEDALGSDALGFAQVPGTPTRPAVGQRLPLRAPAGSTGATSGALVTVSAASGSPDEARRLSRRFPGALAEDMEGFAVALAGHLAGRPGGVLRGISNVAGDAAREGWDVAGALAHLRAALTAIRLERKWP